MALTLEQSSHGHAVGHCELVDSTHSLGSHAQHARRRRNTLCGCSSNELDLITYFETAVMIPDISVFSTSTTDYHFGPGRLDWVFKSIICQTDDLRNPVVVSFEDLSALRADIISSLLTSLKFKM